MSETRKISWYDIIRLFNSKYDEAFLRKNSRANFDYCQEVVEGAKEKWKHLLALDAILCYLYKPPPKEKRQFDHHEILRACVIAIRNKYLANVPGKKTNIRNKITPLCFYSTNGFLKVPYRPDPSNINLTATDADEDGNEFYRPRLTTAVTGIKDQVDAIGIILNANYPREIFDPASFEPIRLMLANPLEGVLCEIHYPWFSIEVFRKYAEEFPTSAKYQAIRQQLITNYCVNVTELKGELGLVTVMNEYVSKVLEDDMALLHTQSTVQPFQPLSTGPLTSGLSPMGALAPLPSTVGASTVPTTATSVTSPAVKPLTSSEGGVSTGAAPAAAPAAVTTNSATTTAAPTVINASSSNLTPSQYSAASYANASKLTAQQTARPLTTTAGLYNPSTFTLSSQYPALLSNANGTKTVLAGATTSAGVPVSGVRNANGAASSATAAAAAGFPVASSFINNYVDLSAGYDDFNTAYGGAYGATAAAAVAAQRLYGNNAAAAAAAAAAGSLPLGYGLNYAGLPAGVPPLAAAKAAYSNASQKYTNKAAAGYNAYVAAANANAIPAAQYVSQKASAVVSANSVSNGASYTAAGYKGTSAQESYGKTTGHSGSVATSAGTPAILPAKAATGRQTLSEKLHQQTEEDLPPVSSRAVKSAVNHHKNLTSVADRLRLLESLFKSVTSRERMSHTATAKMEWSEVVPASALARSYQLKAGLTYGSWCFPGKLVSVYDNGIGPGTAGAIVLAVATYGADHIPLKGWIAKVGPSGLKTSEATAAAAAASTDASANEKGKKDRKAKSSNGSSSNSSSSSINGATTTADSVDDSEKWEPDEIPFEHLNFVFSGVVPITLSSDEELDKFRRTDRNELIGVNEDGYVGIWDRVTPGVRVFGLGLREATIFDEDGIPTMTNGVPGIKCLMLNNVECEALRLENIQLNNQLHSSQVAIQELGLVVKQQQEVIVTQMKMLKAHTKQMDKLKKAFSAFSGVEEQQLEVEEEEVEEDEMKDTDSVASVDARGGKAINGANRDANAVVKSEAGAEKLEGTSAATVAYEQPKKRGRPRTRPLTPPIVATAAPVAVVVAEGEDEDVDDDESSVASESPPSKRKGRPPASHGRGSGGPVATVVGAAMHHDLIKHTLSPKKRDGGKNHNNRRRSY